MKQTRAGLGYGLGAYLLWGTFPFYFGLIAMVNPLEVVPWRVGATLVFCAILATLTRRWRQVALILRNPRLLGWFALSALLLYANWQIFVIGVMSGHVIETSLGYFINPLFTILIGVVVRGERLTRLQWIAVGIAAVGVVIAAVAYGSFPWIALGLAVSFGLYGAVHKHAGESVDGITGLTIETLTTAPIAAVQMAVVASVTGLAAYTHGTGILLLVLLSGVMTAIPLILFGESARRLPLSYLGFLQFLTPILGFLYGFFVMHEDVSPGRWVGFVAVWIALVILIIDMVIQLRRSPGAQLATGPIPLD
ncbi:EamA family transporter RarD [Leucobacter luti]|uniref:Chloramphenicol-sensitive protein RarD n=1 Tax=Leucobacter luti TaxID=340320 RepID=A0A4Q7U0Z1_9MICO|nr:EamA family transporter RarD [Leucobacter luti]MBL3698647.1 EamA family transporter RarD [Leucobacter luti]RZT66022.1 chloramphenicol-sensitive protein RarD [Leucobacter luti]